MIQSDYLHRVYSGLLGMNIGIRLGAPVEPGAWTDERIKRFYGDITGYVKDFKNFAADDDANGPVFFLRAWGDRKHSGALTPADVADAWLNYTREGIGMFWWGGYGVSTEHTAYLNLKAGIEAPRSGSTATNGLIMSEQIGGQIFIDTWGLIFPGDAHNAAQYAMTAASVSHDGNGIYGAGFIAACIAKAFLTDNIDAIIDAGLAEIPADCTYAKVTAAVREHHRAHPDDWRSCLTLLQQQWGYDKYTGVCHMIPNAGVCVMSLLYGKALARGVEIATMAGWDTDCNAGNVGTILGVAGGIACVPDHYRKPINDGIVLSGISGYLNIQDIPTYAREVAAIGYAAMGEEVPQGLLITPGELHFDFSLPGSTHNLRLSGSNSCSLRHSDSVFNTGNGSAEMLFDRMSRGQRCKVYYKPFYRRDDFDDERYMPVFSPTAYPGQRVTMTVKADRMSGESIILNPYVRNSSTKQDILLEGMVIKDDAWREISFVIPQLDGAMTDEIGLLFEANSPAKNKDMGCLYIDSFHVTGKADYTISIAKQKKELASITPFSHNHGSWDIENGQMESMCLEHAEAMTGSYYMTDLSVTGELTPHTGTSHLVSARVQGALRGYYGGFSGGSLAILRNDSGMTTLASCTFDRQYDRTYSVCLTTVGDKLTLSVDGKELLRATDSTHAYGMAGYAMYSLGRCGFGNMTITEL